MATELIFAEERHNKIISMLKAHNKLLVNELKLSSLNIKINIIQLS